MILKFLNEKQTITQEPHKYELIIQKFCEFIQDCMIVKTLLRMITEFICLLMSVHVWIGVIVV